MARKDEPEEVEQQDEEEEDGQAVEDEENGTSINIGDDMITITVPRDGNEGETLSRLASLVDGLGQ